VVEDGGREVGQMLEDQDASVFPDLAVLGLLPQASPTSQQAAGVELAKPAAPPRAPTWIAKAP